MSQPVVETITKTEAARRQLTTAINLWFNEGDAVSIYTLAFASYELIHALSRGKRDKELLYDSRLIKDEYRGDFAKLLKAPASFFKHANHGKEQNGQIELKHAMCEALILFGVFGLQFIHDRPTMEISAFAWWIAVHKPHLLTEDGAAEIQNLFPVEQLDLIRNADKRHFFEAWAEGWRNARIGE